MRKAKSLTAKGYAGYEKAYAKKVKMLHKQGLLPRAPKLSRKAWEETYKATRNTLVEAVKAGERKQIGNVNQVIISRQMYMYTSKQAHKLKLAAEMSGQKLSINQIKAGEFDWNQIKEEYQRGKALGLTGTQAGMEISWFYFGS